MERGVGTRTVETHGPTTPMVLGIVGGVLLGIGSFLKWATVSVDFDAITAAIGVVPPAEVQAQGTASVTGWDVGQGKWTLVTGVVVVVASALLVFASSAQTVAFVVIFGGAVGGSMALYQATVGKDQRLDDIAGIFVLTLPGSLRQYFSVSIGIGLWLCIAGGVVAVAAGIMAMLRRPVSASVTGAAGEDPPGSP